MIFDEEDYLAHYGVLRRSGRYPWGSGGPENASNRGFLDYADQLRKSGLTETEVASVFGISTTELRAAKSIAKNEEKAADIAMAMRLRDKGMGYTAIAERMGKPESSVRALLAPGVKDKADNLAALADMLERNVNEKGVIDIGSGVENHIGVSDVKLRTAAAILKQKGYEEHTLFVDQLGTGPGNKTQVKVLAKPGMTKRDIYADITQIKQINEYSDDGGRTMLGIQPPISVNPKRVAVRYAEEGGADADGVIYVRPGAKDLSLGESRYAQVRVKVGDNHYLKGMAVYKDDLPDGVDLLFNTNKGNTGNKLDAMKTLKDDPDNPFGSVVRQIPKRDKNGQPIKDTVDSAMNLVNEEGDWAKWSKNLSTQMLSKQSPKLIKERLDETYSRKRKELDEINALTNPVVKKKLLEEYADSLDASAVHLKAVAMPKTASNVILPINSLKDSEVYAPNLPNGTRVALVRHPHGGTFEIPELTVNNNNREARKTIGSDAPDAIGINSKVAQRLSGADFDGDTVLVIPNNSGSIKSTPALEKLKKFDPQREYPAYEGMPRMTPKQKQQEMGNISNLITDMTIKGANMDEIAHAVRHSMVVIDAEKHNLNYKQSERDNGIRALKEKYQGGSNKGSSTLISRATSPTRVDERRLRKPGEGGAIDKDTGELVYVNTGTQYVGKDGKTKTKTSEVAKLAYTKDAYTLSSGTVQEDLYAAHSNRLKAMANETRKEYINTKPNPYSPSAKKTYAKEVSKLDADLNLARQNRPKERSAQILANATVQKKLADNPGMDKAEVKRLKYQALEEARQRVGAKKDRIYITDEGWEAIQAGAISASKLEDILRNADMDRVRELATPRTNPVMDSARTARAKTLLNNGHTQAEVAELMGIPVSTLRSSMKEG